jgi:hypothetical protein
MVWFAALIIVLITIPFWVPLLVTAAIVAFWAVVIILGAVMPPLIGGALAGGVGIDPSYGIALGVLIDIGLLAWLSNGGQSNATRAQSIAETETSFDCIDEQNDSGGLEALRADLRSRTAEKTAAKERGEQALLHLEQMWARYEPIVTTAVAAVNRVLEEGEVPGLTISSEPGPYSNGSFKIIYGLGLSTWFIVIEMKAYGVKVYSGRSEEFIKYADLTTGALGDAIARQTRQYLDEVDGFDSVDERLTKSAGPYTLN